MRYTSSLVAVSGLVAVAHAADHQVTVGAGGQNRFSPQTLSNVAVGDTISFKIYSGHNVVQSAFSSPCEELSPGFASGPIYSGETSNPDFFVVKVNDTKPIWAYCAYPNHCQGGMVFAANAPSSGNTFDAYRSAASNAGSSTGRDAAVAGGVYSSSAGASSSGGSSSSASASGSSSSAAASGTLSSSSGSASPSSTAASGAAGNGTTTSSGSPSGTSSPASTSTAAAPALEVGQGAVTAVVLGFAGLLSWFM